MWKTILLGFAAASAAMAALTGESIYPIRPDDPSAVVLQRGDFPVHGDGIGDDSEALQQAIDRVQETQVRGVVLIPEGRYRVTRTIHVWSGIRLIGYGAKRPVIVLGPDTPGFQEGEGRYLLHFASYRPEPGQPVRDANPGTFYSGLSNVDIEIGDGNPAAIGVRSHFAQHGFLAHVDFHTGVGRAGVEAVGNEIEACRFFGGDYGILTRKPSPSWPFVLIDSAFSGQRIAAVRSEEAGMTIIRGQFRDVPTVVMVNENRAEELYIKDSRFERVHGPAIVIGEERSARMQVNLENVVCVEVPTLARFRASGREIEAPAAKYVVRSFSHGLHLDGIADEPEIETRLAAEPLDRLPPLVPTDVPLPPPMATWVSAKDFGAKGDGQSDDTDALRNAIAASRTVFLPAGRYRVSDTLTLRADSVLIGLSPITTQLVLADETPAFLGIGAANEPPRSSSGVRFQVPRSQGTGGPKPLLEAPRAGTNIVSGIGIDTGINHRAVGIKWMAGADSLLHDVRFLGGHGTYRADGSSIPIYNNNRTGDADAAKRWDSQYWSLWVTDGGGGTFKNIWTPNPFAMAGMMVSDTSTPGRVYAMSVEHHVRAEVQLRRVANWSFFALQFEEERGEGAHALPLEIDRCRNLLFANLYLYRVMTTYSPFPYGVRMQESTDVRFRGVHVYSPSKFTFDATVHDATSGRDVRSREIAWFNAPGDTPVAPPTADPRVRRIADGFNSIDSLVTDSEGNVCFVDVRWQRIYRWEHATGTLRLLRDHPLEPAALAMDTEGRLLVVTRIGTVFTFDPDASDEAVEVLTPQRGEAGTGVAMLPQTRWRDSHDFLEAATASLPWHYMALDGKTFIPATDDFVNAGAMSSYFSTIDLIRAYGLARAEPGRPFYVADEFAQRTWRFTVSADGGLADPVLFAEEGEAGVAVDPAGRVYVAAGDIFVYEPDGRLVERITLPERPVGLAFGGSNGWTLYVGARSGLYEVRPRPNEDSFGQPQMDAD